MTGPVDYRDMISYREHLDVLRQADLRFEAERDRRYAEVSVEREKALKIKEVADLAALQLAREIQTYKDEKANQLREQINSERGLYATKGDLVNVVDKLDANTAAFQVLIKPLADYVSSQAGRSSGLSAGWAYLVGGLALVATIIGIIGAFAGK